MEQNKYMLEALAAARTAGAQEEVPIGAVVVDSLSGKIIARSHNMTEAANDPTAHAEILALREACRVTGAPRLPDCDLYVTLEPCPMCATAISFARIRRVYFGAYDPKGGGVEHGPKIFSQPTCHHMPEIYGGIDERACGDILRDFFKERR
jgi:tRNA(Arg) A34 adenosine deaminase TadA